MSASPFASTPGKRAAAAARTRSGAADLRALHERLLRRFERAYPQYGAVARDGGFDYGTVRISLTLDEENEQMRIVARAGKPPPQHELAVLHHVLEQQLKNATPAYWVGAWDRANGEPVVQSHLRLVADMPEPLVPLITQIEMCAASARAIQALYADPTSPRDA